MGGAREMFSIKELYAELRSIREVARRTGHDRKTVRTSISAQELPRYKPRPPRPSTVDPFTPYLVSRIAKGVLNCNVLLGAIRALGYTGGKSILTAFVAPYRVPRAAQAGQRFETLPGPQAQVDWAYFRYEDEGGQRQTVYACVSLRSFSRFMDVEFTERMDLDTLLRCLLNAFEAGGGVPKEVLFAPMKQVVLGRNDRGEVEWHPRMADFAALVGFRPQACRPRRAQTKGKGERLIRYVRENFWPGRRFTNLADLNEQAREWCARANRRVHGTTGAVPAEQLACEPRQPVPERPRVEHLLGEARKVSRDGVVSWGGCRYGVPWPWAGAQVVVKERGAYVEIWTATGDRGIYRHPRSLLPGTVVRSPDQYAGLPLNGPIRCPEPVARRIPVPEVEGRPLAVSEALGGGEAR